MAHRCIQCDAILAEDEAVCPVCAEHDAVGAANESEPPAVIDGMLPATAATIAGGAPAGMHRTHRRQALYTFGVAALAAGMLAGGLHAHRRAPGATGAQRIVWMHRSPVSPFAVAAAGAAGDLLPRLIPAAYSAPPSRDIRRIQRRGEPPLARTRSRPGAVAPLPIVPPNGPVLEPASPAAEGLIPPVVPIPTPQQSAEEAQQATELASIDQQITDQSQQIAGLQYYRAEAEAAMMQLQAEAPAEMSTSMQDAYAQQMEQLQVVADEAQAEISAITANLDELRSQADALRSQMGYGRQG